MVHIQEGTGSFLAILVANKANHIRYSRLKRQLRVRGTTNMNSREFVPRHVLSYVVLVGFLVLGWTAESAPSNGKLRITQLAEALNDYTKLTESQIRRIFEDIGDIRFPDNGTGSFSSGKWRLTINLIGSWDGHYLDADEGEAFGFWNVKDDKFCVSVKESYGYAGSSPLAGCFGLYASIKNGTIAAKLPSLGTDLFDSGVRDIRVLSEIFSPKKSNKSEVPGLINPPTPIPKNDTLHTAKSEHQREVKLQEREAEDRRQRPILEGRLQQLNLELERLQHQRTPAQQ